MLCPECRFASATLLAVGFSFGAAAQSEEPPPPAAAVSALRDAAGGREVRHIEVEAWGPHISWEGAWNSDGAIHQASVLEDGTLVVTEQTVSHDDAPPAIRAWLDDWHDHHRANGPVEIIREQLILYEITVVTNGVEQEILLLPDGRPAWPAWAEGAAGNHSGWPGVPAAVSANVRRVLPGFVLTRSTPDPEAGTHRLTGHVDGDQYEILVEETGRLRHLTLTGVEEPSGED